MSIQTTATKQKGFTLVELLIVVIILAILAAIVVPQFASSTDDAKDSALASNLASIRSAIDLYYQQHGEYPSSKTAVPVGCIGTAATGIVNTPASFLEQLSLYTNADGQACSTQSAGLFTYGPYLKKSELPKNPITEYSNLDVVFTGDLSMTGAAAGTANKAWKFDNISGKFIADHVDYDDI